MIDQIRKFILMLNLIYHRKTVTLENKIHRHEKQNSLRFAN